MLGGTQSLHTNRFDEAIALPTDFAARIARNTQLILAEETGVTHVVDPLGGSLLRRGAHAAASPNEAWTLIEEVEALGGMTKAVESGMPKLRIEEAAARRQARDRPRRRDDRRRQQVPARRRSRRSTSRDIDNAEVRAPAARPARARCKRRPRSEAACQAALDALTEGAAGDGNLLALSIEATRARATVGEISDAHGDGVRPPPRRRSVRISGVYGGAYAGDEEFAADPQARSRRSRPAEGRRPRILVAKLGQDGHDRGAKVIATAFADLGFDVDIGPLFQTPEEAARDAIENDVHVVGMSSQAAGHKTLVPQLIEAAAHAGRATTSSWSSAA